MPSWLLEQPLILAPAIATRSISGSAAAARTISAIGSSASAASTSASRARVVGCRGVNNVQQSSSGRMEIGYEPSRTASAMISSLSMPTSGRTVSSGVEASTTARLSSVCDATWPTTSPVTSVCACTCGGQRRGNPHHQPAVDDHAHRPRHGHGDLPLQLPEGHEHHVRPELVRGEHAHQLPHLVDRGARGERLAVEVHEGGVAAATDHPRRRHRRVDAARQQDQHAPGRPHRQAAGARLLVEVVVGPPAARSRPRRRTPDRTGRPSSRSRPGCGCRSRARDPATTPGTACAPASLRRGSWARPAARGRSRSTASVIAATSGGAVPATAKLARPQVVRSRRRASSMSVPSPRAISMRPIGRRTSPTSSPASASRRLRARWRRNHGRFCPFSAISW